MNSLEINVRRSFRRTSPVALSGQPLPAALVSLHGLRHVTLNLHGGPAARVVLDDRRSADRDRDELHLLHLRSELHYEEASLLASGGLLEIAKVSPEERTRICYVEPVLLSPRIFVYVPTRVVCEPLG